MIDAAERVGHLMEGLSVDAFLEDRDAQDSVSWNLMVLGEAAKGLSPDVRRRHVDVPWREIDGLRDVLVHGYFRVNYRQIWDIASSDVPTVLPLLRGALAALAQDLEETS